MSPSDTSDLSLKSNGPVSSMSDTSAPLLLIGYMATIFLSAFLLFQVQPLISKTILPWFGGTSSVWTICMLFFQVMLFLGYAYAHFITIRLSPKSQMMFHIVVLAGALTFLPIFPRESWKPIGNEEPVLHIMMMLGATVGLPFFVLSATGPLLQRWFSLTYRHRSPYRLFALSNLGSLIALVSYPFVVEPAISTRAQASVWSGGFVVFTVLCAFCAFRSWCFGKRPITEAETSHIDSQKIVTGVTVESLDDAPPMAGMMALWFLLAMAPSVMLLALTNQVCEDVSSVPFLWVLPLAIYLLSFILCFESDRWYVRGLFAMFLPFAVGAIVWMIYFQRGANLVVQIATHFFGLFVIAMCCHGELAKLRPHPKFLTRFYLMISAGGAAGGIYVGAIAPLIHSSYLETNIGLFAVVGLMLMIYHLDENWILHNGRPRWLWALIGLGVVVFGLSLSYQASKVNRGNLSVTRNFFGVLRVKEIDLRFPNRHRRELWHGNILHGMQYPRREMGKQPTTYYGTTSGVGRILNPDRIGKTRRIGIVGLGTGTLAAYGQYGDVIRFYEIDSEVVRLASKYFTFLGDSAAKIDIVLGDARISLEREDPQQFDILVLDAFSSDAIPTHLLTSEAFEVYLKHLRDDGLLAVHISNKYIRLLPVVAANANRFDLQGRLVYDPADSGRGTNLSYWAILARKTEPLERRGLHVFKPLTIDGTVLWTDDFSNLFEVINY